MSEHELDGTQIGTIFKKMCGKRMPEGMRTDCLFKIYFYRQVFDYRKNHRPGKLFTSPVKKQRVFMSFLNIEM